MKSDLLICSLVNHVFRAVSKKPLPKPVTKTFPYHVVASMLLSQFIIRFLRAGDPRRWENSKL